MHTGTDRTADDAVSLFRGERREATALVADMKDSTLLLERLGSEAWVEVMQAIFRIAGTEIYRYGGEIDQYRGDGFVAFFGAHLTHDNDPERAVMAGLGIQEAIARVATELLPTAPDAGESDDDFRMRIGIATGEIIVCDVGDQAHHTESATMGEAVALAARLEMAAQPGTVLVCQSTYRLIDVLFEWEPLGDISVKGLSAAVQVFRPLTRLGVLPRRGIAGLGSPLVGRQTEHEHLRSAVHDVRRGRGGIVTVIGEAGIGKSRLVTEVRRGEERRDGSALIWAEGRSLSYGSATPYLPWVGLLRELLALPADASRQETTADLAARLKALGVADHEAVAATLGRLLAPPSTLLDEVGTLQGGEDPAERQRQTMDAVMTVVGAIAAERPLVLIFEDLHWADSASLDLLLELLPLIRRLPLLIICLSRLLSEAELALGSALEAFMSYVGAVYGPWHTDIVLDVLRPADSRRLVANLLSLGPPALLGDNGDRAVQAIDAILSGDLTSEIITRAGGNPYYMEEIIRALIDGGHLACDPDACTWQADGDGTASAVPRTLRGVLGARMDRLPPEVCRVLKVAAVCGRLFSSSLLEAVAEPAGLDRATLRSHLATLEAAQMVRRRVDLPGAPYIFKHQLMQEEAYASLLKGERRRLHRLIAEALMVTAAEDATDLLSRLAYHWREAGEPERARLYLQV